MNQQINQSEMSAIHQAMSLDYRANIGITEYMTVLEINSKFAEENLSKEALAVGVKKGKKYYYNWGGDAIVVAYELPCLFNLDITVILRCMTNYAQEYARSKEINDSNILTKYKSNMAQHYNYYAQKVNAPLVNV